jgi:Mg-chelatase subunit ChlD
MTSSWDVLRLTLKELINRLTVQRNSPTAIALVQFGTQAQVVQEFTMNVNEVNQKIVEMQQLKGCTNTPAALQRTNILFNVQNLPHRRVVFVLTDGCSTEGDPSLQATKLRELVSNSPLLII